MNPNTQTLGTSILEDSIRLEGLTPINTESTVSQNDDDILEQLITQMNQEEQNELQSARDEVLRLVNEERTISQLWGRPISGTRQTLSTSDSEPLIFTPSMRGFIDGVDEIVPGKKKTKPSINSELEAISKSNNEIFSNIKKVEEELDDLPAKYVKLMTSKHLTLMIQFMRLQAYIKSASTSEEMSAIVNGKYKSFTNILDGYLVNTRLAGQALEQIERNLVRYLSSFMLVDKEVRISIKDMANDVFDFYIEGLEKRKELKSLVRKEEVKETVCEDYLGPRSATGVINVRSTLSGHQTWRVVIPDTM